MKLACVEIDGAIRPGLVHGDSVTPLAAIASDMLGLIARWDSVGRELEYLAQNGDAISVDRASLRAPVLRPGKILAIGLNYADHILETGLEASTSQVWFCKHVTAVNAPFGHIQFPEVAQFLDFEVEMVSIVGRRGHHISAENAKDHIFGFCVGNDFTARDWQFATRQWMLGKSFNTHAPFGPCITTIDEVGDPHDLTISCHVNGVERQRSNTRELAFNVWDQVAHWSKLMTLEPGDVIFTGIPGGVGWATGHRNPRHAVT